MGLLLKMCKCEVAGGRWRGVIMGGGTGGAVSDDKKMEF